MPIVLATSTPGPYADHFLIAMPGMADARFARSVIYVCAHSGDGAMGLILNQPQEIRFPEILVQLGIVKAEQAIRLPGPARDFPVRSGGPVDRSRGFVLHSGDVKVQSSVSVADGLFLTATTDMLRAISSGEGPSRALLALGYSGWGAGQLESEIAANGWLLCPADQSIIFGGDIDGLYDRVLASMGVNAAHLSPVAGHA